MVLRRAARPALRPFVEALWVTDETNDPLPVATRREHVLPDGLMHLVFRLSDDPLRLFRDVADTSGETVGDALVGGARASFYIREVSRPLCSVGAQLRPGAAEALFGVSADELAGRFLRALRRVSGGKASWADLATDAGYSDQAHFNREFREFAGVTPGEYCQASPRFAHHVTIHGDPG